MSDLDEMLARRVTGIRTHYSVEADPPSGDGADGMDVSVQYTVGSLTVLMLPTATPDALLVEVFGFVDGQRVDDSSVLLHSTNRL